VHRNREDSRLAIKGKKNMWALILLKDKEGGQGYDSSGRTPA
jgi:hypothetical protein